MSETIPTPADPVTEAQREHLRRNLGVIRRNLGGLSHEDSLRTLRPGGSHLNWLLAHLVASRDAMLRALGAETVWSEEVGARYGRGSSPPSAADAPPLAELAAALERSQELLDAALAAATPDLLAAPHGRSTVGARVAFLTWHESYHTGQTSLYRQLAGLEGTLG